jgi:hypothetical protein
MGIFGLVLGSAGAVASAFLLFMLTAFGGGGLVAPGRTPPSRLVERYIGISLVAGPALCVLLGLVPWILRWSGRAPSGLWFAVPPSLWVAQAVVIFSLYGKR